MVENKHKIFRQDHNGNWRVWPNTRISLSGTFTNEFAARRAYDKYLTQPKLAKAKK